METITQKKVICPVSLERGDPLAVGYKPHYAASEAELVEHGGVCKACAGKFSKAHLPVVSGKRIETPVDLNERYHAPDLEQDHVAYDAPGELAGVVDFDFAAVDGILDDATPDAREQAGELIRQLFAYCFARGDLTSAAAKFAVIGAGLRPDAPGFDDATQTQLANRLGLTKAAMSKASVKFQDAFGIKFARSRSADGRARMRSARLGGPDRHHHDTGEAAP